MKWHDIVLACVPIYVGLIILMVRAEKRFTRLEVDFQWIKELLINGNKCPLNVKECKEWLKKLNLSSS